MMSEQSNIPFETLVGLVEQLPVEQQEQLVRLIQVRRHANALSVTEKMQLLASAQVDRKVNEEPSPRREDWYSDDGR